jgi:lysophospholipase L1-like esterase
VKGLAKRLLGKAPYGLVENVRREQYNALLRKAYQGKEPLFDLAGVEATAPGGGASTASFGEQVVPALHPAYTDDGGHLNADGRRRAARALVAVLATLPAPATARP